MKTIQLKPGLPQTLQLESNHEPLYKRLPTHDEDGRFLSDFMMLIPGLRNLSEPRFKARLAALHTLLGGHGDVVFADLNTPLNLLWVSVKARHGVITELAAEIQLRVPEARLVGHPLRNRQGPFERFRTMFYIAIERKRNQLVKFLPTPESSHLEKIKSRSRVSGGNDSHKQAPAKKTPARGRRQPWRSAG